MIIARALRLAEHPASRRDALDRLAGSLCVAGALERRQGLLRRAERQVEVIGRPRLVGEPELEIADPRLVIWCELDRALEVMGGAGERRGPRRLSRREVVVAEGARIASLVEVVGEVLGLRAHGASCAP